MFFDLSLQDDGRGVGEPLNETGEFNLVHFSSNNNVVPSVHI